MQVKNEILTDDLIRQARQIDIKSYLNERGFSFNRSSFCRSPFKRDTNWSFKYYPATNTFFDWSSGIGGDVIKLVMMMENVGFADAIQHLTAHKYAVYKPVYKDIPKALNGPFPVDKYKNNDLYECTLMSDYARTRSIKRGYEYGIFFTKEEKDNWVRNPAIMFVLKDENLQPCGVKFRKIVQIKRNGEQSERFSSRGKQGFYILENILPNTYEEPIVFLIESETSANSLWEYCCEINKSAVIISFGSVGSSFERLPKPYENLKDKRLIIDYDGSEKLYQERLDNFKHLTGVKPLKIILPKGEDVNSLYSTKQMYKITNILFNE